MRIQRAASDRLGRIRSARRKRRNQARHAPARLDQRQYRGDEVGCKRFGFSYDWSREISTCEPEYYRWNQWFFLRMLEKGLAYRKKQPGELVPAMPDGLANEQVIDGFCWQHDTTQVEAKEIEQWFLRITQYADAVA